MTTVNIPFYEFWEDKYMTKLKSKKELQKLLAETFLKQIRKIVTTCNTGHSVSAGFIMWQLGYEWALDDGASWNFHAFDIKIINLFEIVEIVKS